MARLSPRALFATTMLLSACDAALSAQGQPTQAQATPGGGATVTATVQADIQLKPDQLDLESINYLIKKGKVKDAGTLEKKINDKGEKMHKLDVDGDGKLDKIQIVEVKQPNDAILFELHVIPSSKGKAAEFVVAHIDFVPDKSSGQMVVKATYAPCFIGYDTMVFDYTVPIVIENDVIVVHDGPAFFGWLFAVRPVYVGVIVVDAPVIYEVKMKHKHKFKGKGKWH